MEILITLLIIAVITLGFTTYNLLRKNEKQEDVLAAYLLYMDNLSKIIEHSSERLKKIDTKGTFESDDEIGWFSNKLRLFKND